MKADWEVKKLGDVCEINIGRTPERGNSKNWDKEKNTNNVWLSIADLNNTENGYISDSTEYVSNETLPKMKLVKANTLLMSFKLTIGRCAITARDLYTNEAIAALPIKEKELNLFFLKYYLENFNWDKLTEGDTKVKGKTLNKEKLNVVPVPVPPLPEQKRIVEILDQKFVQIDQLKQNAEKNLQNAKELFQAELTKAFSNDTWEKKRLGEVATVTSSKRIFKDEYVSEGIPFYRTKEIKEISHNEPISLELFISKQKYEEIKQNFGVPQIGDVLISAVGTIGEILVIENENPFYFKDGNIIWLKNIKGISPIYLKYQLKSFVDELKNLTRGAAYNALTIEKLKECKTPLPPLSEQKRIVEQLDSLSQKVRQLEEIYTKQITNCDELKQSFLKKAFEGEL